MSEDVWSGTDFPYLCLKDEIRTKAFQRAIQRIVKKGDIVIDAGSGSGILAFFAASAGAKKVYAVEIDHLLAQSLQKSIKVNGMKSVIEVVEGNILTANLPKNVDILIAEMIETGLLDELQIPSLNTMRKKEIITNKTKIIPSHYKTFVQLVNTDNTYYGYTILSPKHEWPFYSYPHTNWYPTSVKPISNIVEIFSADFSIGIINEEVDATVSFTLNGGKINALKLSGLITLAPNIQIGPTNGLNGDKILPIDQIENIDQVEFKISYRMGEGLGKMKVQRIS